MSARTQRDYALFIQAWQTSANVEEACRRLRKDPRWKWAATPSSLYGVKAHLAKNSVELKQLPQRPINYGALDNLASYLN